MATAVQPGTTWREQRVRVARAAMILALGAILVKLWIMQIVQVVDWREESRKALTTNNAIPASRGVIYDRNGEPLASNDAQWTACVTLEDIEDYAHNRPPWRSPIPPESATEAAQERKYHQPPESLVRICQTLAEIINAAPDRSGPDARLKPVDPAERMDELCKYSWAPYKAAPFATDLEHDVVMEIVERLPILQGVTVVRQFQRKYDHPAQANAFHLLGYVQRVTKEEDYLFKQGYEPSDVLGKQGIERYYEPLLKGTKGREVSVPDQPRKLDPAPAPGEDLVLAIDARLQAAMEESLARQVEYCGGDSGAAVAMDPQTGEVYALASYPAFRSEWFGPEAPAGSSAEIERVATDRADRRFPWANQAISSKRAPASTFKFVTLAAACEEDVIDPATYGVVCAGRIQLGSTFKHCWVKSGHGGVGTTAAVAQSCNIYFYSLGMKLGEERLVKWARLFGFGEKTGIDLPHEVTGLVGDRAYVMRVLGEDGWYDGHSANFGIGQGPVEATAIQVAVATSAIANGGRRVVPRVVARISKAGEPQVPVTPEKETVTVPLRPKTLMYIRRGMWAVCGWDTGTAFGAFSGEHAVPVRVAGKTGSSEVDSADAWFTCFAPYAHMNPSDPASVGRANATPRIAVTVLIINGGHGGDSAAPVARDVIAAAFNERGEFAVRPTAVR